MYARKFESLHPWYTRLYTSIVYHHHPINMFVCFIHRQPLGKHIDMHLSWYFIIYIRHGQLVLIAGIVLKYIEIP